MLESGVLANKKAEPFFAQNFVSLLGQPGDKHTKIKVPDPDDKTKEIEVCAKYPTIPCEVHRRLNSELRTFAKLGEFKTTPYTVIFDPIRNEVIDTIEGEWAFVHLQRKMDLIEKAMPGPRVDDRQWGNYRKALSLIEEEKYKEAQGLLSSLLRRKPPERMRAALEKKLDLVKERLAETKTG